MRKCICFICLAYIMSCVIPIAHALSWESLWKNKQQREVTQLNKGINAYRQKQYEKAATLFNRSNTSISQYNRGNALAKQGQIDKAIKAYTIAIKHDPKNQDAIFNRNLLEKLKKQQEQKQHSKTTKKQKQDQSIQAKEKEQKQKNTGETRQSNQANEQQRQANQEQSTSARNKQSVNSTPQAVHGPKKQANQQWLDQISDDPGGLLKQKFLRDHYRQQIK